MRTVPAGLQTISDIRTIHARVTVRDNLLRFDENAPSDDAILSSFQGYDDASYSTGLLRVANNDGQLYYMPVANMSSWAGWTLGGVALMANSIPGVYTSGANAGSIYVQRSDGQFAYCAYTGTLATPFNITVAGMSTAYPIAIAPVNDSELYIAQYYPNYNHTRLYYTNMGTTLEWLGALYNGELGKISAVRFNDTDYIFLNHKDRILMITRYGNYWSEVRPVFQLDILSEVQKIILGGASLINDQIMISGIFKREYGTDIHFYSFGPQFSMGRDFYIDRNTHTPERGGRLHLIGDTLWYTGPNLAYSAPATLQVGYDNPALKYTPTLFSNPTISCSTDGADELSLWLSAEETDPLLKPGSEITFEAGYNDVYGTFGTYEIDSITTTLENGSERQLTARDKANRRLTRWFPETDLDYWSQTRLSTNPSTLENVIRGCGTFNRIEAPTTRGGETEVVPMLAKVNEHGILYTSQRSARGMIAKGLFSYHADSAVAHKFGLILNYYREAKYEAAERLGVGTDEVSEDQYGHTGIAVVYGPAEHSGAPGVSISRIEPIDNSNEIIWWKDASFSLNIPSGAWYWLQAEFHDGLIRVLYRAYETATWTQLGTYRYAYDQNEPWYQNEEGRAAIYLYNGTTYGSTLNFSKDSLYIPATDIASFPTSETVIVDNEQIEYNGKTANPRTAPILVVQNGFTHPDAPNYIDYSTYGYEIYLSGASSLPNNGEDYYNDNVLVVTDGSGKSNVFKITKFNYDAPYQWVPTQTYTLPDTWYDHIGDPAHGSWQPNSWQRIFVAEDTDGKIGPGSSVTIKGALFVTQRGANETTAVSHSSSRVSVYRDISAACCHFDYATTEMDMPLEWTMKEIAKKAGINTVTTDKLLSGQIDFTSHAGWDLPADYADHGVIRYQSVCRFKLLSGSEVGIAACTGSDMTIGWVATVGGGYARFYDIRSGSPFLLEAVPLPSTIDTDTFTFSMTKEFTSIWINDYLVATFSLGSNYVGGELYGYRAYVSNGYAAIEADWPELDQRIDNFICEIRQPGLQLMSRLVGMKRAYTRPTQDGGLRIFGARKTVNTGEPYLHSVHAGKVTSDSTLTTRLRVEGGEIAELIDYDMLKEHGNYLQTVNAYELDTFSEAEREAALTLQEITANLYRTVISGAADMRIEPNDLVQVTLPEEEGTIIKDVIVETARFAIFVSEDEATFDMDIGGRNDNS